jgi:MFS family permease
MFTAGLAVFTAASVLCGLATGRGLLVAARALQGVGGAMTSAVVLGMLVALFPEPREQARAIAVFSAVGAAGGALGTFLGGALTQTVGWHWIFLINLPIGVVAWVARSPWPRSPSASTSASSCVRRGPRVRCCGCGSSAPAP